MSELTEFAGKHFPSIESHAVPLHLLRAWLVLNEYPDPEGGESLVVNSLALDDWIRENAVKRVVDIEEGEGDNEITRFFEHGWHKAGAACKTHITQSSARITRLNSKDVGTGMKRSETTGQLHECYLPENEKCYWSGDPYASHEVGY